MSFLEKESETAVPFKVNLFRELWALFKVMFLPGEANFLEYLWYCYQGSRRAAEPRTISEYLDDVVRSAKNDLTKRLQWRKIKNTNINILDALYNPYTRKAIMAFLEKQAICREDIRLIQRKMRQAWRMPEEAPEAPAETYLVAPAAAEAVAPAAVNKFHAKAYVIAAQLYFEISGKAAEFDVLSRQMPQLEAFIKEKFKIDQLPGNFHKKFKGYSYKPVLKGKNASEKGQLKPFFRQIIQHPEVFGEAISLYARQISEEDFSD